MLPFTQPDSVSIVGFLLVVAFVIMAFLNAVDLARLPTMRIGVGLLVWLVVVSIVVASGIMERNLPLGVALFFGVGNLVGVVFALSPMGRAIATHVPVAHLIVFQAFRLPLELVLHSWAAQGTIPETMTWSGSNLDVLTGILALIAAPLVLKLRGETQWTIAWCFNITGLALLLNVGRVAVMSSPMPFAWQVDPPLVLALHMPYAWIGPVCVAGALAGHIVLTRALLKR
jgi:hypothetical protein